MLKAGTGQTLSVSFAPTDSTDYTTATGAAAIHVAMAPLTVTANNASKVFGTPNPTFSVTDAGFVNGDGAAQLGGTLTFSTAAAITSPVGTYSVTPSGLASSNYAITFVPGTLTVTTLAGSFYVLDPTASGALSLSGNAGINTTGNVVVDSNSASAILATGNAMVTAASVQIVGGVSDSGNAKVTKTGAPGATGDPMAGLATPSTAGLTSYGKVNLSGNSSQTLNPGVYSQITASGNASLTLNSGIYVIEGGGLSVSGNASVSGASQGVTIFNAGSNYPNTGGSFGSITLSGNGSFSLSAASAGTYAGIVIFQSRDNSQAISLSGNAVAGLAGTVYAPKAQLVLSGNGQLKDTLVVDTMSISGNAVASERPMVRVVPGTVSLSESTLTVSKPRIASGGKTTVTLTARDAAGNQEPSGGLVVKFALGTGSAGGTFSAATDNKNGTYTATFTGIKAGSVTITAMIGGKAVTSTRRTVRVTKSRGCPRGDTISCSWHSTDERPRHRRGAAGVVTG